MSYGAGACREGGMVDHGRGGQQDLQLLDQADV